MKAKDILGKISKNKKQSLLIALIDALFVGSLLLIAALFDLIIPTESTITSLFENGMGLLAMIMTLALVVIYIGLLITMYSYAKYLIFHRFEQMSKKSHLDMSGFKKFIKTNMMVFFVILLFLVVVIIFANIFSPAFGGFLGIFFIICLYIYINIRQSLFFAGKKYSITALSEEIGKFRKYKGFIIFNTLMIAGWAAVFYAAGSVLLYNINSFNIAATAYDIYTPITNYVTYAFFYIIFFYNRAYFYFAACEK